MEENDAGNVIKRKISHRIDIIIKLNSSYIQECWQIILENYVMLPYLNNRDHTLCRLKK